MRAFGGPVHRGPGSRTAAGWARTRHSFSFGEHYDPDNVGFGTLVALNDETRPGGAGYPEHPHRDTEIVTWVLSGVAGARRLLRAPRPW